MHHEHPDLVKDQYWDELPQELPYTAAAEAFRDTHPLPSTANIAVRPQDQEIIGPTALKIDEMQNYADGGPITFSAHPRNVSGVRSRGSQSSLGTSVPGKICDDVKTACLIEFIFFADSMSRVNSVTNMLKRFFSREDSRTDTAKADNRSETNELNNLIPGSESFGKGSVKKLTDQVIEEVCSVFELSITFCNNISYISGFN